MNKQFFEVGMLFLVLGNAAGCATSARGGAARGTVLASAPGTRAIVAGPVTMHAYAGFSGGEIYRAPAATGPDADCARVEGRGAAVPLPADRVVAVTVAAGEIACLRTEGARGYELVWHADARESTPRLAANVVQRQ
jgi:hypothetical protein